MTCNICINPRIQLKKKFFYGKGGGGRGGGSRKGWFIGKNSKVLM